VPSKECIRNEASRVRLLGLALGCGAVLRAGIYLISLFKARSDPEGMIYLSKEFNLNSSILIM